MVRLLRSLRLLWLWQLWLRLLRLLRLQRRLLLIFHVGLGCGSFGCHRAGAYRRAAVVRGSVTPPFRAQVSLIRHQPRDGHGVDEGIGRRRARKRRMHTYPFGSRRALPHPRLPTSEGRNCTSVSQGAEGTTYTSGGPHNLSPSCGETAQRTNWLDYRLDYTKVHKIPFSIDCSGDLIPHHRSFLSSRRTDLNGLEREVGVHVLYDNGMDETMKPGRARARALAGCGAGGGVGRAAPWAGSEKNGHRGRWERARVRWHLAWHLAPGCQRRCHKGEVPSLRFGTSSARSGPIGGVREHDGEDGISSHECGGARR